MMENEEIMNSLHKPEQEYCMILSESMKGDEEPQHDDQWDGWEQK
jgi:hypothetical protein